MATAPPGSGGAPSGGQNAPRDPSGTNTPSSGGVVWNESPMGGKPGDRPQTPPSTTVPPVTPPTGTGTTGAPLTGNQQSAYDYLTALFHTYGLDSLAPVIMDMVKTEANSDAITLKLRQTAQYKARFPAMEDLNKRGIPFSEADYFNFETRARTLQTKYDLPPGFLTDPDRIANLLRKNVDGDDLTRRVELNVAAALDAPKETRDALQSLYGLGAGALNAFYLDPDNATSYLERVSASARIAGAGLQQDFTINRDQAERYAALGYTEAQARQNFESAANLRGITDQGQITADEIAQATFGDVAAQQKVSQVATGRKNQFAGGGGAASNQSGVAGLGTSRG